VVRFLSLKSLIGVALIGAATGSADSSRGAELCWRSR
jgi:hypothetical protein